MTLRHPMYFNIHNVQYKTYESYSRMMCFDQENCSFKIFQVDTMCIVYYVHLEHSSTRQRIVYLFALKRGNRITTHLDYVSNKYQI